MSKMTRIKNSYVEVFKKFAQNTRQHCYTKLDKKPKIAIFRCLKNHVKIELEIWNFAGRLDLDQKFQGSGVSGSGFSETPVLQQIVVKYIYIKVTIVTVH